MVKQWASKMHNCLLLQTCYFFFFLFDIQHDFTKVVHNFPIKAIQMQYSLSNDKSCSTSITEFLNNSIFNQTSKQAILIKCTT